jgi:hypothetical protein
MTEMSDKSSDATAGIDLPGAATPEPAPRKVLPPAAQRALAEAEARRAAATASVPAAKEFQGPEGPEPTRFGDWERKGIASDF